MSRSRTPPCRAARCSRRGSRPPARRPPAPPSAGRAAGKTWAHVGLHDAQQIAGLAVDPRDPERAYAAVLGHPYGPNAERGVFRSTDGGGTWAKVLYKDENTGASAVALDPSNPDVVYAALWAARQGPWEDGEWQGPESGL